MSDITYEELIRASIKIPSRISFESRTLPMRNWYLISSFSTSKILFSCESTLVGHYLWGIDTTPTGGSSGEYWSDITYEELIRVASLQFLFPFELKVGHYLWGIDTRLRMFRPSFPTHRSRQVGHYLWGIDTSYEFRKNDLLVLVGHYLWGIDTYTSFL